MIKKTLSRYFRRFSLFSWGSRIILLILQAIVVYAAAQFLEVPLANWLALLGVSTLFILFIGFIDNYLAQTAERNIEKTLDNDVGKEMTRLQKAKKRKRLMLKEKRKKLLIKLPK